MTDKLDIADSADSEEECDANSALFPRVRWYQRLRNRLWGYDFFISYHWASGGTYAVNLAARLREKGYEVFLDRAEYAMGDDWKRVGEIALRNTQRLVLIATREAVFESEPVEREVILFSERGRRCIPIFFGDTFAADEEAYPGKFQVLARLPDSALYLQDTIENLPIGPVVEVVEKLGAAHGIMRRRQLRQTITLIAVSLLTIFSVMAGISAVNARIARNDAIEQEGIAKGKEREAGEARGRSEKLVADMSLQNGRLALNTNDDVGACLLWYAQVLQTNGEPAASSRHSVRRLIGALRGRLPRRSLVQDVGIRAVSLSPNGEMLAAGLTNGTVRLWDMATGEPHLETLNDGSVVDGLEFSPNGKMLATVNTNGTARLWDVQTGRPHGDPLQHKLRVYSVSFSPDGTMLATASADGTARLWDVQKVQPIGRPLEHKDAVVAVSFSPDGKVLATGSWDGTARLWEVPSTRPFGQPFKHDGTVLGVNFSPNGKTLAAAVGSRAGPRGGARMWNVLTGLPVGERLQHQDEVLSLSFSPNGKMLATASADNTAQRWDAITGQPLGDPLQHRGDVLTLSFSTDGKYLATASGIRDGGERPLRRSEEPNEAQLWDAISGERLGSPLKHHHKITGMSFSIDGNTLTTGSLDGLVRLWNVTVNQQHGELPEYGFGRTSFGSDCKLLATQIHDTQIQLWDVETSRPLSGPLNHGGHILAFALSPDGKTLATAGRDNTAQLWDTVTSQRHGGPLKHKDVVWELSYSPDGKTLASGSENGIVRLWNAVTGQPRHEPLKHNCKISALSFSPDGNTLAVASSSTLHKDELRFWDVVTGKPRGEPLEHPDILGALSFSPDGNTIASSTSYSVFVWDVANGLPLSEPLNPDGLVKAVSFSPDGQKLAIATIDGIVRFWDTANLKANGEPLKTNGAFADWSFNPNALTLAIATGAYGESPETRLWDLTTRHPLGELLYHKWVYALSFSSDGKRLAIASVDGVAQRNIPEPAMGDSDRVQLSVELRTGRTIENGLVRMLTPAEWVNRKRRLDSLGGDCLH